MAEMATADINDLPDSDFAYVEDGGTKDGSGKTVPRSLRHFPIHDAAHVRNALARAADSPFGEKAMLAIKAAAKKFGIDETDRSAGSPYGISLRSAPVEVSTKGRTVEAYAAIFNTPVPVADQDGRYEEVLDPTCFNRTLDHQRRSGRQIPVLLNHGMTIFQTPSEEDALPIGVTEEIHADSKGLFTRAHFHDTPRANNVLECIKDGSIRSYSFSGIFKRSDPVIPRGGFRQGPDGALKTVRRMESTLREFGPATFPVYEGAEVVGVRAEQMYAALFGQLTPDEFERLAGMYRTGTLLDPPDFEGTPDEGPAASATDDSPEEHSTRSITQKMQDNFAEWQKRLDVKEHLNTNRARFIERHG